MSKKLPESPVKTISLHVSLQDSGMMRLLGLRSQINLKKIRSEVVTERRKPKMDSPVKVDRKK